MHMYVYLILADVPMVDILDTAVSERHVPFGTIFGMSQRFDSKIDALILKQPKYVLGPTR